MQTGLTSVALGEQLPRRLPHHPRTFNIIACIDRMRGLAKDGKIPWRGTVEARGDMPWFVRMTQGCTMIMGRKTYEDCGQLITYDRVNLVVGSHPGMYPTLDAALEQAFAGNKPIWVIGGGRLYKAALQHPALRFVYENHLIGDYNCDIYMPAHNHVEIPRAVIDRHRNVFIEVPTTARVYACAHVNMSELAYLALVDELLRAPTKPNRTGIPTRSVFMRTLRFPLVRGVDNILPLLTTKKMALSAIVTELLWFLNAQTNTAYLRKHGCKIWDANASREFLDSRKLAYPEGTLGPVYGWQWRGFNSPYPSEEGNNDTKPQYDQIAHAIHLLKTDPMSRRIVVSAWNPCQIDEMALPPCHYAFQFVCEYGSDEGVIVNCVMHMRSADVGLGVPFNIASYALLTHIIVQQCGSSYRAGELVITMADCHIYTNHMDGLREQVQRWPRAFPTVRVAPGSIEDLYAAGPSCVQIAGYDPHPVIKLEMAL
jgi:thymidylate synthase